MIEGVALASGVFVGNWLVVPLVFKSSFQRGFEVGAIAASLVLLVYNI